MHDPQPTIFERILKTTRPDAPAPLMEELLGAAGLGLWELDLASGELIADRKGMELLGLSPATPHVQFDHWLKRIHPEDRKQVEANAAALAAGAIETGDGIDYRIQLANGRWRWIRSNGNVVERGTDGQALRAAGSCRDITELKDRHAQMEPRQPRKGDVNRIFASIREIDQLVAREQDRATILQKACEIPVNNLGFHHCMILWNEESAQLFQAGMAAANFEGMQRLLDSGTVPDCMARALESDEIAFIQDVAIDCPDCPFSDKYDDQAGLAVRLECEGRVYGALVVAAPAGTIQLEQEREVLRELADELAYALHKLEAEQQRVWLNSIVNTVHNPIIMVSAEGRYLSVNTSYASLYGIPVAELLGKTVADFIGEERFQNEVKPHLDRAMKGEIVRYEVLSDFPARGLRWMQMECIPFRAGNGAVTAVIAQGTDITERKEQNVRLEEANRELSDSRRAALNMMEDAILAQQQMEFEQALFRTFMDTLPAAVFFKDSEGRFVSVNKAMAAVFGTVPERLVGQCDADLFPKEQAERKRKDELTVMESRQLLECEEEALDRYYRTTKAPRMNEAGEVVGIYGVSWDITDRIEIEKQLKLSQFAMDHSSLAIFLADRDGRFHYVNAAACRQIGYSRDELLKMKVMDVEARHVQSTEEWSAFWAHIRKSGSQHFEGEHRAKNGRIFPVDIVANFITWSDEEYVIGFTQDITDRKAADAKLKRSRSRFSTLLSNLPGMAYRCSKDEHWTMHFISAGCTAITGYRPEDLIENNTLCYNDLICPEDREAVAEQVNRSLAQGDHFELEYRIRDRSGAEKWVWERGIGRTDTHGDTVIEGFISDMTRRKKAEVELQRLSTAIEQSPESIVITDSAGVILYVNPTFEKVSGFTRAEALGHNPRLLKSGEQKESQYRQLWQTISAGKVWEGRFINKRKDGSLFTEEASIAPVLNEQGKIINYVAIKRDITQELLREEELRQSQKMEAIGLLAGGVAHDFNNILQAILGFSELLIYDLEEDSLNYQNVVEIQQSATKAVALTKQLLTFGRKNPVDMRRMNINDTVYDTEALISILLGEQYELELELGGGLPEIDADSGQLTQIIMNLAVNARDAMPEGGRLTITTELITLEERDAVIPGSRPGSFVCLSITDTGCGIDEHLIPRLFEPFFTTKDVGKGTGLGLSVVYGIVKQCRGWANVYSEKGHGTTFKLFFPATGCLPGTGAEQQLMGSDAIITLVVDDDPQTRSLMVEILEATHFRAVAAGSVAEAVELFEQHGSQFGILLADMILPDGSGLELANQLRSRVPDLPVLLCSGYRDQSRRWEGLKDSNYHFINKPFTAVGLVRSLQETIINTKTGK